MGHASAETVEVQAQHRALIQQRPRNVVQRELPGRRLLEDALAHQVAHYPVERVAIGTCSRGKLSDLALPGINMTGNSQCRNYVDAPRRR